MSNQHKWAVNPDDAYVCANDCGSEYDPHNGEAAPSGPCPGPAKAIAPRRRAIYDIPHRQASEIRWVDVAARPGVGAHRDALVTTACDAEIAATLVTRINRMVRCHDCRLALAADTDAADFWLDQLDHLIAARTGRRRDMYIAQRDDLRKQLNPPVVADVEEGRP